MVIFALGETLIFRISRIWRSFCFWRLNDSFECVWLSTYSWMASVPNSPIIDWVRYSLVVISVIMDIISKWTWIYHHTMKSSTQYPVDWMCLPCYHIICLLCFRKHKAALHVTYQCRFCGKFLPARGSIYGWLVSTQASAMEEVNRTDFDDLEWINNTWSRLDFTLSLSIFFNISDLYAIFYDILD